MKHKSQPSMSLAAIAKECGLSAMTVSRALRTRSAVKPATRQKILEIAERLGYIRSPRCGRPAAFRNRTGQKIQLIAGTTGRSMAIFHSSLITAVEQQAAQHGYDCVIRTCNGDYRQFVPLLENTRASDALATLIIGSFVTGQLKALVEAVPGAVLLDNPGDPSIESPYCSFAFENGEATRLAIRHLLDTGRRRILLVGGTPDHFFTREIEQGYREALAGRGLAVDERLIRYAAFTPDSAHDCVTVAMAEKLPFDAVFTNDEMAPGVYRALMQHGRKIPQDIAVCGCDGLEIGLHLFPRLTTVVLNYTRLGQLAVQHILEKQNDRAPCRVRMLPELEVRESTGGNQPRPGQLKDGRTNQGKRYTKEDLHGVSTSVGSRKTPAKSPPASGKGKPGSGPGLL